MGRRFCWPVLLFQVIEDPLQLSLLLCFHGDEDLGRAAGLAERRALVQRLAVVLDQHVLVIAAGKHTHTQTHTDRWWPEMHPQCTCTRKHTGNEGKQISQWTCSSPTEEEQTGRRAEFPTCLSSDWPIGGQRELNLSIETRPIITRPIVTRPVVRLRYCPAFPYSISSAM